MPLKIVLSIATLLGVLVVSMQTVPEMILFQNKLLPNLIELESVIDFHPIDLTASDGLVLRSWYYPPRGGKPVIVYFPGRGGDVSKKPSHLFALAEQGFGLTLTGYRGYGGNPGRPSEKRLYEDAASLLSYLADGLAPDGIVLYGYSMGTGIASHLASQWQSRALILEAPFTSFTEVVHNAVRPIPSWLVRTRFDTWSRFAAIEVPILLLAGQNDQLTPPTFAERLASINADFTSLYIFPDAHHDDLIEHGASEAITNFLKSLE